MEQSMNWDAYFPIENTRNKERLFYQIEERNKYMAFDKDKVKSLIELIPEDVLRYVTLYKFQSYLNFCFDISLDGNTALYCIMSLNEMGDNVLSGNTWVRDMSFKRLEDKEAINLMDYTFDKPISLLANAIIKAVKEDGRFN